MSLSTCTYEKVRKVGYILSPAGQFEPSLNISKSCTLTGKYLKQTAFLKEKLYRLPEKY
jgi:hypothetical protein